MESYQLSLFTAVLIACALIGLLVVYSVISRTISKRRYYTRLRQHSCEVARLEEEECTRLAYDLHDGILPQLATIRLQLRKSRRLGEGVLVEKAEENLVQAIGELRSILRNLVPRNLQEKGLRLVLEELFQQYQALHAVRIDFTCALKRPLTAGADLHLYRLVQEVVHNALTHADATAIQVVIRQTRSQLFVVCQDNGKGLTTVQKEGFGLSSLKLRTVLLNGEVQVHTQPRKGTTYFFKFPYSANNGNRSCDHS